MSGTKAGGAKAAKTNKERHGADYYARIGKKGGENGHSGGFASNPELAKLAGQKGGRKSKRGSTKIFNWAIRSDKAGEDLGKFKTERSAMEAYKELDLVTRAKVTVVRI